MAFHLERPYLNNVGNNKRKPSAKQQRAQQAHDKWLLEQGVHPTQLEARQSNKQPRKLTHVTKPSMTGPQCNNGFAPAGAKRSVFDTVWQRTYEDDPEMAKREAVALREAEAKSKRVAPAYSKGAYQYITSSESLADIGKKK
jgi:hypothetical protein